jgi:hypothetical protein
MLKQISKTGQPNAIKKKSNLTIIRRLQVTMQNFDLTSADGVGARRM